MAWDLQGDGEGALEFLRDALRAEADTADVLQDADLIGRRSGQLDGLLAIYDDASGVAAGVHGRQALHYRRALASSHREASKKSPDTSSPARALAWSITARHRAGVKEGPSSST